MRTNEGKSTLEVREAGDPALSKMLAGALQHQERHDHWTHGFHTYPAGLHPRAASDLIEFLSPRAVYDPFCGGGTSLIEAMVRGIPAFGADISPIARLVALGRTTPCSEELATMFRSRGRALAAEARRADQLPPPEIGEVVSDWYAPYVACELESLRLGIEESDPQIQPLLWLAFSSLLIKVSWRRSDTSAQHEPHRRPPGTTSVLFHKKVRELARRAGQLHDAVPEGTPRPDIRGIDAREPGPQGEGIDLILTSPPYPGVYDYLPMQHLRATWLGMAEERPSEIGARRHWRHEGHEVAYKRWRKDTLAWVRSSARTLVPGGHLIIVVGDGLTPEGPVDALGPTVGALAAQGMHLLAQSSLARPDHARASKRWEHVLMAKAN